MRHIAEHDSGNLQLAIRFLGALLLGAVLAAVWVTAAHGERDVPRAAVEWLTGSKPSSVSALYDALLWLGLAAVSLLGIGLMVGLGTPARPNR